MNIKPFDLSTKEIADKMKKGCRLFVSPLITLFLLLSGYFSSAQTIHQLLESELSKGTIHPSTIAHASLVDTTKLVAVSFKEDKKKYIIQSPFFLISLQKKPFAIVLLNKQTKQNWVLDSIQLNGKKDTFSQIKSITNSKNTWEIITDNVDFKVKIKVISEDIYRLSIESGKRKSSESDKLLLTFKGAGTFFGGGERFIGCELNGRQFTNQPHDHAWLPDSMRNTKNLRKDEPTYLPIPFIFTPQGNGIYVDEAKTVAFNLQNTDENAFSVLIDGHSADVYFFAGASPKQVLSAYTSIVGRSPLPPEWAFGVWVNLPKGKDSVTIRAVEMRKLDIPVDVIWTFDFDDPESNTGWTYWTNGIYGNLRDLTDTLHKLNYRVFTYLRSFVNRDLSYYNFPNPIFQEADKNNLILPASRVDDNFSNFHSNDQVNFYNPASINWWGKILKRNLQTEKFDGWMEDFGDISYVFDHRNQQYTPMQFHLEPPFNQLTNQEIANLYPLIYHKITHQLSIALKPDMTAFSRSGSAGSAAFTPIVWGGDQEPTWDKHYGYPSAISAGISAGLSGYGVWTPDILSLSPSRELWMRWVEFGALTPIMRDHLWDYQPQNIRIWTDAATRQFFKKYAKLHQTIRPYLYKCAQEVQATGIPVIRHLMLEYPQDTTAIHCEYEYLLGDKILVAPVIEAGKITQKVYLPEGNWKYYWTDKIYSGQTWVTVDAPIEQIPFFFKQ